MQVLPLTSQGVPAPALACQEPCLAMTGEKPRPWEVNLLAQGSKRQKLAYIQVPIILTLLGTHLLHGYAYEMLGIGSGRKKLTQNESIMMPIGM